MNNVHNKTNNKSNRRSQLQGGKVTGSMTKRELHSEASRLLASKSRSWDDWDPTMRQKRLDEVPSIKSNSLGQKQLGMQTRTRPIQNNIDRRQVKLSSQNRNRLNEINSSRDVSTSRLNLRPVNGKQTGSSSRNIHQGASLRARKRPNQPVKHPSASREIDRSTLRGEAPPQMDSTLFYPVGSSVKHRLHGRGIVQAPPNGDAEFAEKMLVRVKFVEDSIEWDLPMDGLVHTYE